MNSGIQCLLNSVALVDFFLSNKFYEEINYENPVGTQGVLVKKFANVMKRVWCMPRSHISPISLKNAIGKFQPMVDIPDSYCSSLKVFSNTTHLS
jgi:ubiquitin carboxyl-terminal hydrolase 4/11/15